MDPKELIDAISWHIALNWPKYLAGFVIVVIIGSVAVDLMN
jgi:hypothetical protein